MKEDSAPNLFCQNEPDSKTFALNLKKKHTTQLLRLELKENEKKIYFSECRSLDTGPERSN